MQTYLWTLSSFLSQCEFPLIQRSDQVQHTVQQEVLMRYAHLSEVALVPFFRRFLWRKNGTRRLLPPSIEAKCLSSLKIKQANEAAYLGRPLCDCASLKHLSPEVSQPWDTLGSRHWTKYQSNSVITISTIETHRESIQKAIFVVLLSCTFSKQTDF